jgi:hypothetical protein
MARSIEEVAGSLEIKEPRIEIGRCQELRGLPKLLTGHVAIAGHERNATDDGHIPTSHQPPDNGWGAVRYPGSSFCNATSSRLVRTAYPDERGIVFVVGIFRRVAFDLEHLRTNRRRKGLVPERTHEVAKDAAMRVLHRISAARKSTPSSPSPRSTPASVARKSGESRTLAPHEVRRTTVGAGLERPPPGPPHAARARVAWRSTVGLG